MEGLFAKTSRSGLQPVELAKRLMREMDAGKVVGLRGVVAPNHFVFSLSPADGSRFEQAEQVLVAELEQVVRDAAGERGWGLIGPPEVELFVDDAVRKGEVRVEASLVEGEEQVAPAPAGTGATLLIHEGGSTRTVRVGGGTVTIGRLPECEVVIHDPGASRRHAQLREQRRRLRPSPTSGSTNGTQLNGQTVQSARARRRRPHHDRHDAHRVPEGLVLGAASSRSRCRPSSTACSPCVPVHLAGADARGVGRAHVDRTRTRRKTRRARRPAPSTPQTASIVVVHEPDGAKPRTFTLAASDARRPRAGVRHQGGRHVRLAAARAALRAAGRLVRGGPRLDERHVRERAAARRAGALQPGDKIRVGTTMLELQR